MQPRQAVLLAVYHQCPGQGEMPAVSPIIGRKGLMGYAMGADVQNESRRSNGEFQAILTPIDERCIWIHVSGLCDPPMDLSKAECDIYHPDRSRSGVE